MVREYTAIDNEFIITNSKKMDLNYKLEENPFRKILIFEDKEKKGFLDYSKIYENIEINYIYTIDKFKGQGIASKLMEKLLLEDYHNITLEVRESNIPAIKLYEKFGFKKISIRKNYYGNESAILMIKEWKYDR